MYIILRGSLRASHYVTDVESLQAGGGVMLLSLAYCPCGSDFAGWNGLCLIVVTCCWSGGTGWLHVVCKWCCIRFACCNLLVLTTLYRLHL